MSDNPTMITEEAKQKFRRLLEARDDYAAKDQAAKKAKAELDDIELEVFDMCHEAGITGTFPVPLGPPYGTVKFKTRATHFAKIVDESRLLEHYENRGMVDEISVPSFLKRRLHEEVREIIDNNGELPPGLTYYTNRGMTITRPK